MVVTDIRFHGEALFSFTATGSSANSSRNVSTRNKLRTNHTVPVPAINSATYPLQSRTSVVFGVRVCFCRTTPQTAAPAPSPWETHHTSHAWLLNGTMAACAQSGNDGFLGIPAFLTLGLTSLAGATVGFAAGAGAPTQVYFAPPSFFISVILLPVL